MDVPTPPPEFICPISQDIMKEPVEVKHNGVSYYFDKVYLETWKKTENGDKNPLTMVEGFLSAEVTPCDSLKKRITDYCLEFNINQETCVPELQPFSDFEQIQEDERVALELNRELNAPSRAELLAYFMEREYTNYLADIFRDMVESQIQQPQNMPENNEIINNIPHIVPHNIVNYIMNIDPINPDDDQ